MVTVHHKAEDSTATNTSQRYQSLVVNGAAEWNELPSSNGNHDDPWALTPTGTSYQLANFAGLPLQVGLIAGGFESGNLVTVGFDSFMLDASPSLPVLKAVISAVEIS